ncbi:hypothetical protein [Flavobacterium frigoris]|uniref:Uncharacterized protein n=1 Tax=Flavobacterium frigoris TaxID=229204 RepID=A0A1H9RPM5_FLAFI|nr:hypothetical protein [Flavobacterium frigoris]SER74656.1 hypothetical protein SAMN05444355_1237 [Flavobacterium frigoris]
MKKQLLVLGLIVSSGTFVQAQENPLDLKFRRSSLHTMVIESDKFPKKEIVLKAFNNAPFPEKYNDHQISQKSFDPINYTLTVEEKATIYKPSKVGAFATGLLEIETDSVSKELPLRIEKYLIKEKIANKIVAKWFNRQADGSFDSKLVEDRGVFNASFLETKAAQSSSDGEALLRTAGEELIDNTFVVINKFNFVANEPVARAVRDAAKTVAAQKIPAMLLGKVNKGIDAVYEKTKEGFSIWATSYLYKLVWDKATSNTFYTDLYIDKTSLNPKKKAAFDTSDLFKLEFVGDESASGLVTFSLSEKRTEDQIIELSTVRIIDNVYAKLQKKYDVFKTKTPLYTGDPITAKIGKKEGLEGGEKFDVLEQVQDPKTGVITYKSVGTIKVEKDAVWDNTFNIEENSAPLVGAVGSETKSIIDRTTFSGGKKFQSGMLIKQIK